MTDEPRSMPEKSGPIRTCAGCGKRVAADELVRVVVDPTGSLAIDLAGSGFGRGGHVHPVPECLNKAVRGGFSRVFKAKIDATAEDLAAQIVAAVERRIEGLLAGARRGRHLVMGADSVSAALREGKGELVVVACDAAAAAKLPEVVDAIGRGRAIAWADKKRLGALFGRDEVGVCAVLNEGVAGAIFQAHRTSRPFVVSRSEACWSPEVR